jgi:hypothetical protein
MTTPKASGPLWGNTYSDGEINPHTCTPNYWEGGEPCRLVPGHGKVVPVEDVNAILAAYLSAGTGERWQTNLKDAIDKAIGGAM